MNRTGLVVIGAAVAIVGYAIVYNGLSFLSVADGGSSPAFPYGGVGIISGLVPGALKVGVGAFGSTIDKRHAPPGPGGGRKHPHPTKGKR